jgi:selenocysteine lyase/cysteine desulfurase
MVELNKCLQIVGNVIHASVSECVLVMNATTGVNKILRSLPWKAGDSSLYYYYSTVYGSYRSVVNLN